MTTCVQEKDLEYGNCFIAHSESTPDLEIVGQSTVLRTVFEQVQLVAQTNATVLILGETGSGKELVAKEIHNLSTRRGRAFVKMNCSAIPAGLLESELFGHEKGAFTGAMTRRIGRFEAAANGTFFLDEIGDLPLELQPKLLRALQEREFERLGGLQSVKVDVRLIAATHRDLPQMVSKREFRSDLFYRLNVFPIRVPPLRERAEDIPLLVTHFVRKFCRLMNRSINTVPASTIRALQQWHWPGNIRELENFIERSVILSKGSVLNCPLEEICTWQPSVPQMPFVETVTMEDCTREHILKMLCHTKGVVSGPNGAAALLGIKRTTLQAKMRKLGISRGDWFTAALGRDPMQSAWSASA
jgi:formate hydrogenlyase transcriptional activator